MRRISLLLAIVLAPTLVYAHGAAQPSARVSIRGSHVALELKLDIVNLLIRVVPKSRWKSPVEMASSSEFDIDEGLRHANEWLASQIQLKSGNTRVTFNRIRWPKPQEVLGSARQAAMAQLVGKGKHPKLPMIVADAIIARPGAVMSLTLPPSLGISRTIWLEPQATSLDPGSTSSYLPRRNRQQNCEHALRPLAPSN